MKAHSGIAEYRSLAAFIVYAVVISLLPVSALPFMFGADSAFHLLAGDAYLYLGIAENAQPAYFSFDGEQPTNGFHPLWQYWVWAARALAGDDPYLLMNVVAWSNVALNLTGAILVGLAIRRATRGWAAAVLATPGAYYLLVGQGFANLSIWDLFNGMENGLALFITSVICLFLSMAPERTPSARYLLGLGTALAALVLTRLDEIFVVAATGLFLLTTVEGGFMRRFRAMVWLCLPTGVAVSLFLVNNHLTYGAAMPISGAVKGGLSLLSNGWVTLVSFFAPAFDLREALTAYTGHRAGIAGAGFRVAELVYPAALAGVLALAVRVRFGAGMRTTLLMGMSAGILLKALYNFVFVNYWHQSSWYFAFAAGMISFLAALAIAPEIERLRRAARALSVSALALLVGLALLLAGQDYARRMDGAEGGTRAAFFAARGETEAALRAGGGMKLIEFGDGFLNYALNMPVRHGFLFAGDVASVASMRRGAFLRDSYASGYNIISSFEYLRAPAIDGPYDSERIRMLLENSFLIHEVKQELRHFDFEMLHIYEPLRIPFIRIIARPESRKAGDG